MPAMELSMLGIGQLPDSTGPETAGVLVLQGVFSLCPVFCSRSS